MFAIPLKRSHLKIGKVFYSVKLKIRLKKILNLKEFLANLVLCLK